MQKLLKSNKFWLLRPCIFFFSIGGGVVAYQIYCLNKKFSNLVSPSVNEQPEYTNCYISLSQQQTVEVEISSFLRRLLNIETFVSTILKGPKYVANDTNPWHLLRILKSNLYSLDHYQALKTLACSTYSEGLSREVAQACDLQTAVKLARIPDVNLNLFLPPPSYLTAFCGCVEDELSRILSIVKPSKEFACAQYFLDAANQLIEAQKNEQFILNWDEQMVQYPRPIKIAEVTELYLQALLHQSCSFENSKLMIQNGLLPTLWRVLESFPQETKLRTLAVEIIANISQYVQHHVHIFQSGWIRLFAELLVSDNVRLSLSAGKALANMEESMKKHGIYDSSVYLLHPLQDTDESDLNSKKTSHRRTTTGCSTGPWDVDVIFVHGLLGGVSYTWRQSEMVRSSKDYTYCWPKDWLPKDVPGLRVLGINYTTSLSHWKNRCPEDTPRRTIDARSDELLNSLQRAGVGNRPIVWVAHSMGGLLVKQVLIKASKSKDSNISAVSENTKAVLMLSVPHGGSPVATLNPPARFLFLPSVEVEELRKGSNVLEVLNQEFAHLSAEHPMAVVNLIETKATPVSPLGIELKFVETDSAGLCSGEVHFVPVNHLEICKPLNRNAFVYQRLIRILEGLS